MVEKIQIQDLQTQEIESLLFKSPEAIPEEIQVREVGQQVLLISSKVRMRTDLEKPPSVANKRSEYKEAQPIKVLL